MSDMVPTGSKYSDEDRMNAVVLYAVKGVASLVSKDTGISESVLCDWRKTEWWNEALAEVRSENTDEYISRYHELVIKGSKIALEKLPEASARDAMIIAATANDKLRLALNQPTSISSRSSNNGALMDQLRQLSSSLKEKAINVVSEQ